MKSKRLIASLAAASMLVGAFSLTGCSKDDDTADDAKTTEKSGDDTKSSEESSE